MQLTLFELPEAKTPPSLSGKMCQAYSAPRTTPSAVSLPSSREKMKPLLSRNGRVLVWSMEDDGEWRGPSSTLNGLESPNGADGSSLLPSIVTLLSVLEDGPIPPRFFLSAKACAGILRRARDRGKALPDALRMALEAVASA